MSLLSALESFIREVLGSHFLEESMVLPYPKLKNVDPLS